MLYPIVFIIGFLLSGIWFSFHIYVSQKLKNTKKALHSLERFVTNYHRKANSSFSNE